VKVVHTHKGKLFTHKKNDILELAVKQMNLEDIVLRKISQIQKGKYPMFFLYVNSLKNWSECIVVIIKGRENRREG
jgi:hypothetical protein